MRNFLGTLGKSAEGACTIHKGYTDFEKYPYDVLINCVGAGTLNKHRGKYTLYFTVTEEYDNLAIGYLRDHCPDALYISFSSGAVYGREHSAPVEEGTMTRIKVNHIAPEDYYGIARLNAEAKHRAFDRLKIVDLRVFSYFSRFIDLTDGYFITDLLDCVLNKKVLVTDSMSMIRDYLHPEDLFSMIIKCLQAGSLNTAFDVVSTNPVEKKEILDYFSAAYGLKYETSPSLTKKTATGSKGVYCSTYHGASKIGYVPRFSSLETIMQEAKHILA